MNFSSFKFEDFETGCLERIENEVSNGSEMNRSERFFLNGLVRKLKPRKILEIGVSTGASSAIILNAINNDPGAHLYSVDILTHWYQDPSRRVGDVVYEKFPDLTSKWSLFPGAIAASKLDEIGGDIDFCLLDAKHQNPGEILEYLTVLPYMRKNGIIVTHDTSLHTLAWKNLNCVTCCILFNALPGDKNQPAKNMVPYTTLANDTNYLLFPNIGAVKLADDAMNSAGSIFNLLTLPWAYKPYGQMLTQIAGGGGGGAIQLRPFQRSSAALQKALPGKIARYFSQGDRVELPCGLSN